MTEPNPTGSNAAVHDELVDRIVAEIVKRVAAQEALETAEAAAARAPAARPAAKPKLLLSGPQGALRPETEAALLAAYDVVPVGPACDGRLPKAPVLFSGLGLQALVRVSQGDEGCTVEGMLLLEAILEGRRAVIVEDGILWRRHADTAPKRLIASYLANEAALKSYGALICPEDEVLAALSAPAGTPGHRPSAGCHPAPPPRSNRVLTEARVRELCPPGSGPGRLALAPGDVLTPLAKDYLSAQKIETA